MKKLRAGKQQPDIQEKTIPNFTYKIVTGWIQVLSFWGNDQ